MIVKKVPNPKYSAAIPDRIRGLTSYIVRPELTDPAEKCLYAGARGVICDNLRDQQNEMIALATVSKRAVEPIVHYVLSWHEDEVPSSHNIEEAVDLFLAHLGLTECQVIYGLHIDTTNAHLHLCINRIDPNSERPIRINGGFDLEAAHQAIAIIEDEQCWRRETNTRYVASGANVYRSGWDAERPDVSARARDKELRTGEVSAQTKAHHVLDLALETAQTWREFHAVLARAGMRYRPKGNGAVVDVGSVQVKASTALRRAAFKKLVKHFGAFVEASAVGAPDPDFTPWLEERRQSICAIVGNCQPSQLIGWHKIDGFEGYRVEGRTYYSRRRGGAVAFVDEGERVRVMDSRDEEAARAALKLAAAKWPEGVHIEGSADFKRVIARLAAAEGIRVTNPEMQADIKKEQAIRDKKAASFAKRLDLQHSVTTLVEPLGADRYEVLVPGRTRPGEEAQGARQVLSSPDGRGFGIDTLADAVHDAQARGAAPTEIQLVPRALDQDYLVSSAQAARQAGDHPLLPGPARLALALPGGRTMALGSARRGDRLALHQLASEVADHGLPSEPAKKAKGSNPRPDLARHVLPLDAKRTTMIAKDLDDNPALEARRNGFVTSRKRQTQMLTAIRLDPVRLLRSPPNRVRLPAGVFSADPEAIGRLRADAVADFPAGQGTHPSRIDAALALRLRVLGATREEIAEILAACGAAPYQADPYVTPTIYANRLAAYTFSPAADAWVRDHQHLAEIWRAVEKGAPIPWPDPENDNPEVKATALGEKPINPEPPQTVPMGEPDVADEPEPMAETPRAVHVEAPAEDDIQGPIDIDYEDFLALVARAAANLQDLPEFGGPDEPEEQNGKDKVSEMMNIGPPGENGREPISSSPQDQRLFAKAESRPIVEPLTPADSHSVDQPKASVILITPQREDAHPRAIGIQGDPVGSRDTPPSQLPATASMGGIERAKSSRAAPETNQKKRDSHPPIRGPDARTQGGAGKAAGLERSPASPSQPPREVTTSARSARAAAPPQDLAPAIGKNQAKAGSHETVPVRREQARQPRRSPEPEKGNRTPIVAAGNHVPFPKVLIDALMEGLPEEIPILLEARRSAEDGFSEALPALDPLRPVKRLVKEYPQFLTDQPPGADQTFSIAASLSVRELLKAGLDISEDEGRIRRARIEQSIRAITEVIQPRWAEMTRTSPCPLYRSDAGSPLRGLVRLWLDHRRILDQPGIANEPDRAYRSHWICRKVAGDLAPLMREDRTNPLTNWPGLRAAVGMTIAAELTMTAPRIGPKIYQQMLQAARVDLGKGQAVQSPGKGTRFAFPPALPSKLTERQSRLLLLAARLDAIGQLALTDRMLALDPALTDLHAFVRLAKENRDGPDRESLIAAIKATQRATLDRQGVEPILRPLGASPQVITRILASAPASARGR